MQTNIIRQRFLDYFKKHNHRIIGSSSLVPLNDQSLLFTNAGMVQFKNIFLGKETVEYSRAVSSQLCIRAGGKHNDLENVGYTARHHTLFEMLGNFSFGDYFKREAIQLAWDFLTVELKLPSEKLWVTVYQDDLEAEKIWLEEMKIDSRRFSRQGDKDNFWSMGETGPCGPCSEIFYDHGEKIPGGPPGSADADGDRYVEIWNLVFMQYDRSADGQLTPLPKPSVDTGMGLERLAAVMQGVSSNYGIDLFVNLINAVMQLCKSVDRESPSLQVIADHIRSCGFLIAEGVMPSNEGRGYVLRRIIRRAIRHGYKLGMESPFFHKLVKPLVQEMGEAYPELKIKQVIIENILLKEEEQFARTLQNGMELFEKAVANLKKHEAIPGEVIFRLYDTYGFPVDLTADIARERNIVLDMQGFDNAMTKQREKARAASQFANEKVEIHIDSKSAFVGYEHVERVTKVSTLIKNNQEVSALNAGEEGIIILETTPFYPEGGGQVGDKGRITWADGAGEFAVLNTTKVGDAILHHGNVVQSTIAANTSVIAKVDVSARQATALNHSATHLLHAALRKILGTHVQQKGSLVASDRLRFDFSHPQTVSLEELTAIEEMVNQQIRANTPVHQEILPVDEAKQKGAVALFGEKYGEKVRVLSMGSDNFSMEFCGGTHVNRTGDIGLFHIVSEAAIASGVRRIEAITGEAALKYLQQTESEIMSLATTLKVNRAQLNDKLQSLLDQNKQLQKTITDFQDKILRQEEENLVASVKNFHEVNIIIGSLQEADNKSIRDMADRLKSRFNQAVVVLGNVMGDKVGITVSVTKNVTNRIHAGELADYLAKPLGGKGGGRPDSAQAGAAYAANFQEILDSSIDWLKQKLVK